VVSVAVVMLTVSLLAAVAGCTAPSPSVQAPNQSTSPAASAAPGRVEALFVVDCLLPGQVRKLGKMTFLTARRPIKTSAQDCEIRGGEYVAYDRADYRTSLNVWLPQAQEGDKEAQTYVGEIYEKGLGVPPDYVVAATWYRKAAAQGHSRAQINLGYLYEKGLGVEKDPLQALSWYRQASGLKEAIVLDTSSNRWSDTGPDTRKELQELRQEVEQHKAESVALRQQLERTQQQLGQTQQELERRQRATDTERQHLEQARQELEQRKQLVAATAHDDTEVKRLTGQLQQREAELDRQQQEVARLQQEKTQLEEETTRYHKRLTEFEPQQQVALAGPTIEVVDPPVVSGRRGLSVVQVSAGIVGQQRDIVGKVTAPAGVLSFTVNDRAEKLDDHGLFHVPVMVRAPAVPVKVVAVDRQGKSANVELQLTVDKATPPPGQAVKDKPSIAFGTYHALVIGNTIYAHWPSLNTPGQDARAIAEVLSRKYGFKTKALLNATRFDILQALNDLRKMLTENDNLLVYYAGHGHWEQQIQRGYWVPVDSDTDSDVNWISTVAITDILSAMSARHVLIVADSCYSGALTRSALARLEAGMSNEARDHWLKSMAEKRSRTVLSSGGIQPVLDEGGGNHSVFAKAFLDVLASNAEILDGQRLGLEVAARVSYAAASVRVEQDPQYAPIRYSGHEAGDFLFVPTVSQ
jgi:uncharacterized caspase-like protein